MAKKQSTSNNPVTNEADEKAFNSRLQECPIAIVGMASIFADAKNLENSGTTSLNRSMQLKMYPVIVGQKMTIILVTQKKLIKPIVNVVVFYLK